MRVDRLVGIIMVLLEHDRVSARELSRMFEVSPRTVYRDIEAICMAGIPVRAVPGVGGGFQIMPGYKVQKGVFSTAELSSLLQGLASLSGIVRPGELSTVLAKVRGLVPPDGAREVEERSGSVCVDLSPWTGNPSVSHNLQAVQAAIEEGVALTFDYVSGTGERTRRTVEPCRLVLKGHAWYMQAFCRLREDYRLFRLSRVMGLETAEKLERRREAPQPCLDPHPDLKRLQTDITLRVHVSIMDRVLDHCPLERCTPDGPDHYLVRYPFVQNDYYYDQLLGLGPGCECVAPAHVRDEVARRLQAMVRMYET